MPTPNDCPCGSSSPYEMCCGMYHHNPLTAPTAEALMRSRYAAFVLKDFDYIAQTQQLESDPNQTVEDIANRNANTQWIQLEITDTENGGTKDKTGMVAFNAHFKEGKHIGRLSERSLFKKVKGVWYYLSGEHEVKTNTPLVKKPEMNLGRNDPCYCGSSKKFKKCCGAN